jgi:hypothetical protein
MIQQKFHCQIGRSIDFCNFLSHQNQFDHFFEQNLNLIDRTVSRKLYSENLFHFARLSTQY